MIKSSFWRSVALVLQKAPFIMYVGNIVLRFIQPKFTVGVVGLVYDDEGRILLVEHVFHPHIPWGLPGGWIHVYEDPHECAKREIMEELQLDVIVERLLLAEQTLPRHMDFVFLCRPNGEIGTLSSELLGYAWVDPHQTPRLVGFHRRAIQAYLEGNVSGYKDKDVKNPLGSLLD